MRELWKNVMQNFHGSRSLSFLLVVLLCFLILCSGCRSKLRTPVDQAEDAWLAGDCQKAASEYESYLQKNPRTSGTDKVHFALGNVYCLCKQVEQRDLAKAQEQYKLAAEQTGDNVLAVTARQRVAEIYVDMNRKSDAIAEYENLLQRYPDTAQKRSIRLAIANLYNDLNNYSQAETEYEKVTTAVSYDQLSEAAYIRVSNIDLLRERYDRAIPVLEKIVTNTNDPHIQAQARFSLSEIYVKQFQYDEALEQLKLIKNPSPAEAEFIKKRTDQIQRDRKKHTSTPTDMDWSN
jgi:predicted negative regulator of RcsB-dependent stress response